MYGYDNERATAVNGPAGRYAIAVNGFEGSQGSYTLALECIERRVYLPIALRNEWVRMLDADEH